MYTGGVAAKLGECMKWKPHRSVLSAERIWKSLSKEPFLTMRQRRDHLRMSSESFYNGLQLLMECGLVEAKTVYTGHKGRQPRLLNMIDTEPSTFTLFIRKRVDGALKTLPFKVNILLSDYRMIAAIASSAYTEKDILIVVAEDIIYGIEDYILIFDHIYLVCVFKELCRRLRRLYRKFISTGKVRVTSVAKLPSLIETDVAPYDAPMAPPL